VLTTVKGKSPRYRLRPPLTIATRNALAKSGPDPGVLGNQSNKEMPWHKTALTPIAPYKFLGGKRAYGVASKKDRSLTETRHSIASAK